VLDRFFSFSSSEFERVVSITARATTERFADVRTDRLRGPPQLTHVHQPREPVDECADPVGGALGGVEHIEAAVWHVHTLVDRRIGPATVLPLASPFLRRL
jgi:hypothetical protein